MMAVGGPYKNTDIWAAEKTRRVWRGWKWQQKIDRRRRALEDKNDDQNEADKGRAESAENGGRETAVSRVRAWSSHCPLSCIRLLWNISRIHSEADVRGVTVPASEEEAALEEEVEVEDRQRFFKPCICINRPFTRLRVLAEGAEAAPAAVSEEEEGCVPVGAVVGGEVISSGVRRHRFHRPRSAVGGRRGLSFRMPAQTGGGA